MLYTWDDPSKDRSLRWNVYNKKSKGFVAEFWKVNNSYNYNNNNNNDFFTLEIVKVHHGRSMRGPHLSDSLRSLIKPQTLFNRFSSTPEAH